MAAEMAVPIPKTNQDQILSVSFNQEASCLALGLKTGFDVYNSFPFSKCYSDTFGGISIVQMLYCSSLVALVGDGDKPAFSRRKLFMYNTKDRVPICELNFVTAILSVRLNRKRVIVVRENKIHIHDISNMKILHTLDTASNPKGLCALSPDDNSYIAYPSNSSGHVYIYDALSLRHVTTIAAHNENLNCLNFNRDGSLLATASEKGTIIRVFEVSSESKKCVRFRRGAQRANIQCITFSLDSTLLCVSSDTGTIHVFKLDESMYVDNAQNKGVLSMMGDVFEPARSIANIKLPNPGPTLLCAFSEKNNCLIAVTNGAVFHYLYEEGEYKFSNEYPFLCE